MSLEPVSFTAHAIDRYIDRVAPGADRDHVARQLELMRPAMALTPVAPPWLAGRERHPADRYLLAADIVFILRARPQPGAGFSAVTCLVAGPSRETLRRRRRARRPRSKLKALA